MSQILSPSLRTRGLSLKLYRPTAGDGCVLWLPGQDDAYSATIRDRSGNANNGTISGATWIRLSSGLWCLNFDGTDDYMGCGSNSSVLPNAWTLLLWIKFPGGTYDPLVLWSSPIYGSTPGILLGVGDNFSRIWMSSTNYRWFNPSPVVIRDDKWHQLAFLVPGSGQTDIENSLMYADTKPQTITLTSSAGAQDAKATLRFGVGLGGERLRGLIALQRLFGNRLLTESEIKLSFSQERYLFGV